MRPSLVLALSLACALAACNDIERFSTAEGESYHGHIVDACFMRRGFPSGTELCMTFDANRSEDSPGIVSTSDRQLDLVPLRAVPELLHDPLSTLSFGEGRNRNLVYILTPQGGESTADITAVVSLMHSGTAEVRLLRGAASVDAPSCPDSGDTLFAVFTPLTKREGSCSF